MGTKDEYASFTKCNIAAAPFSYDQKQRNVSTTLIHDLDGLDLRPPMVRTDGFCVAQSLGFRGCHLFGEMFC